MRILRSLWSADLWLLAALCSFSSCAESGRRVTQQELGVRWPLTVESGHLDCDHGALVFRYDGTTYALNVTALSKGNPGIDPIWKTEADLRVTRPIKVDLTPLIDLARQECK